MCLNSPNIGENCPISKKIGNNATNIGTRTHRNVFPFLCPNQGRIQKQMFDLKRNGGKLSDFERIKKKKNNCPKLWQSTFSGESEYILCIFGGGMQGSVDRMLAFCQGSGFRV